MDVLTHGVTHVLTLNSVDTSNHHDLRNDDGVDIMARVILAKLIENLIA
jgi:hypothetical protein